MSEPTLIRAVGTVVRAPSNARLFVEGEGHIYAIDDNVPVKPGDTVEFHAVYGDQFATVTAINREGMR